MNTQKTHLGIYGILIDEGKILLIKKSRGPYIGKLDLPGGKMEHGESLDSALNRELEEETGVIVKSSKLVANLTTRISFEYESEVIDMYHVGLIYKITESYNEKLITNMNVEDSLGAQWTDINTIDLNNLSSFARGVIEMRLYED